MSSSFYNDPHAELRHTAQHWRDEPHLTEGSNTDGIRGPTDAYAEDSFTIDGAKESIGANPCATSARYKVSFVAEALQKVVVTCLDLFLYQDAIAAAERLHEAFPTSKSLYTLAESYLRSGDAGSSYRLLKHYFPFSGDEDHYRLVYLLGVACGITGRYAECLAYMRSVPLPPPPLAGGGMRSASDTAEHMHPSDRVSSAAVLYWIGLSESRQGCGESVGTVWSAALKYCPALLHTFESCVTHSGLEGGGAAALAAIEVPLVHESSPTPNSRLCKNAQQDENCIHYEEAPHNSKEEKSCGDLHKKGVGKDSDAERAAREKGARRESRRQDGKNTFLRRARPTLQLMSSVTYRKHGRDSMRKVPTQKYMHVQGQTFLISQANYYDNDDESVSPCGFSGLSVAHLDAARSFVSPIANVLAALHTYNCSEAFAAVCGAKGTALVRPAEFSAMFPLKALDIPKTGPASSEFLPERATAARLASSSSFLLNLTSTAAVGMDRALSSPSYWCSLIKAQCCLHTSDHANSCAYYAEAMRLAPWRLNEAQWINYSTSLWHQHDMHGLGHLSQILMTELGPTAVACAVSSNYYSRLREPKLAVEMLNRAVTLDGSLALAHTLLGYEELAGGNSGGSSQSFHAALKANPRVYMAIAGLAEIEGRKGNESAAREFYYKSLAINPLPAVIVRYAATYHRREATEDDLMTAIHLYDEVLARQPYHPVARLRKAAALLQLGDPRAALREVEVLQQQGGPKEAEVYVCRGRCFAALGDKKEAILALTKAVGLETRSANEAKILLEDLQSS